MSSKKITCKRTSRQVFIRVYRLQIQSVMLAFSTQNCALLPLKPSLLFDSPPLPPFHVNKYTLYTYTVCEGWGYGVLGLRQINTCRKVPLQVNFFSWRHFALSSISLSTAVPEDPALSGHIELNSLLVVEVLKLESFVFRFHILKSQRYSTVSVEKLSYLYKLNELCSLLLRVGFDT